jgi:hypothetical protein
MGDLTPEAASEAALFERFARAAARESWLELNPHLHVSDTFRRADPAPMQPPPAPVLQAVEQVREEGWCRAALPGAEAVLDDLVRAVDNLRADRWHPAFAFVYDEIWQLAAHPFLTSLLTEILGPGYTLEQDFWVNYVPPHAGSGWVPHVDDPETPLAADGRPHSLTVWVPLTDATLENSCMYLLPSHRMPRAGEFREAAGSFPYTFVTELLHAARAVPAPAGSVVCWGGGIVHWGAPSERRAAAPRVSVALSYRSASAAAASGAEGIDLRTGRMPFTARLKAIGAQFMHYQRDFSAEPSALEGRQLWVLFDRLLKGT